MRNDVNSFYKKYCRVLGQNIVIEAAKTGETIKYSCPKKDVCPSEECCLKHLLEYKYAEYI